MNLSGLFRRLNDSTTVDRSKPPDVEVKMPFKESSTLNQILYVNERHNKRPLPKNDERKNLSEILVSDMVDKQTFDKQIDSSLHNTDNEWKNISIAQRRTLLETYCETFEIVLDDQMRKKILRDERSVNYSRDERRIREISMTEK